MIKMMLKKKKNKNKSNKKMDKKLKRRKKMLIRKSYQQMKTLEIMTIQKVMVVHLLNLLVR
jgi:hypothetical protein